MLVDRLRRVYEEISRVERVAAQFSDDIFVRANLVSLRYDAEQLEAEWSLEAQQAQQEVCRYRMIPSTATEFAVSHVTKSLLDFQELFSQIYEAVLHGAKKQARLTGETVAQTRFNLAFTYPGSLGVAISIDSKPTLFEGQFDQAIEAFMQVIEARDERDVRDVAKTLGEAVVKKTFDWARVNLDAHYAVDLDWTTAQGIRRGGMIGIETFNRLVSVIGRTSDSTLHSIKVQGSLVGFDSMRRRFRFVDPEGDDFAGPLSDDFNAGAIWPVNDRYTAEIEVEETVDYATDITRHVYRLNKLDPLPKV